MSVFSTSLYVSLFVISLFKTSNAGITKHPGVLRAEITESPYVVALLDDDLDEFLGLGVLVSKNVVFCEEVL